MNKCDAERQPEASPILSGALAVAERTKSLNCGVLRREECDACGGRSHRGSCRLGWVEATQPTFLALSCYH